MIRRLDAGEKAIDLTIEKWEDMFNGTGIDEGGDNCACCYVYEGAWCHTCAIHRYEIETEGSSHFCGDLPHETDKVGIKDVIEYLKRVKQWMIEKGEYE